jgi:hypothetical protein
MLKLITLLPLLFLLLYFIIYNLTTFAARDSKVLALFFRLIALVCQWNLKIDYKYYFGDYVWDYMLSKVNLIE